MPELLDNNIQTDDNQSDGSNDQSDDTSRDHSPEDNDDYRPGPDFEAPRQWGGALDVGDAQAKEAAGGGPDDNPQETQNLHKYTPTPTQGGGISTKKKLGVGGGVAGAILALVLGISSLLPFKLFASMQMIGGAAGARVENYIEHRTKLIMMRAIMQKLGVPGDVVITNKGTIDSLLATLRTTNFEKVLSEKGLEFVKDGDNVSIKQNGKFIGTNLKNETRMLAVIESNSLSKKAIKSVVKENIPAWRVFKRAKFVHWLMLKYHIPRLGKAKSTETDPNKKIEQLAVEEIDNAAQTQAALVDDTLSLADTADGEPDAGEETRANTKKNFSELTTERAQLLKAAVADKSASVIADSISRLGFQVGEEAAKKVASKFIPVYGWVTGIATFVVLSDWVLDGTVDGSAAASIAAIKAAPLAAQYGTYEGLATQQQLGELDPDYLSYYMARLDDIAGARAFVCIDSNWDPSCATKGTAVTTRIDERNPKWLRDFDNWLGTYTPMSLSEASRLNAFNPTIYLAKAIYYIDGFITETAFAGPLKFFTWVGSLGFEVLRFLTPDTIEAQFEEKMRELGQGAIGWTLDVFGLSVDLLASGEDLFNNLYAGGDYAYNQMCREELSCHEISSAEATRQYQQFAAENNDYVKGKGLLYALFSPDITTSLTTKLALRTPTSSDASALDIAASVASLVSQAPTTLAGSFSSDASAYDNSSVDLNGVIPTGLSDFEIEQPLSKDALEGIECAVGVEGFDPCKIDTAALAAFACLNAEKIETAECNPDIDIATDTTGSTTGAAPIASEGGFAWPISLADWNNSSRVKSYRIQDCDFRYSNGTLHTGVDIGTFVGTQLYAGVGGVVSLPSPSYGMVNIAFKDAASSRTMYLNYQHLNVISVTAGQTVNAGDPIGKSGSKGTTAAHLHMSLWDVPMLSGHDAPSAEKLIHMWNPLSIFPGDGRDTGVCSSPFTVPGGN